MKRLLTLTLLSALTIAACGGDDSGRVEVDANEPLLRITSEGGFVPIEFALNNGPRYTVLGDGRVIYQGPQAAIFPGPIYVQPLVAQMSDSQVNALLAIIDRVGLPDIEDEVDDSATQFVADATTEVASYWDENGEHRYGVYALGLTETSSDRNDALLELIETLDRFTAQADAEPYGPERVRILAGEGFVDEAVKQVRNWPTALDISAFDDSSTGFSCAVFEPSVVAELGDANGGTVFVHPVTGDENILLVRALHPGEPECP